MSAFTGKRPRVDEQQRRPQKKKISFKKQKHYHSSSEDEEENTAIAKDAPRKRIVPQHDSRSSGAPNSILKLGKQPQPQPETAQDESDVDLGLDEVQKNTALNIDPQSDSSADDDQVAGDSSADTNSDDECITEDEVDGDLRSDTASTASQIKKRNDPSAFATSISRILDTKLTATKRADPVLSRSKSAAEANRSIVDNRLEQQAKDQIRAERRTALDKGRVRDVLGLETPEVDTGAILEEEKRLKKTAQRGVVQLFNAVRAAQVKADQSKREARESGVVGAKQREERATEMSKQGFLDLISAGGKKAVAT